MNIQLLSDLHLEAHPHFVPEPAPGADVLVLAGDVGSYQQGSQLGDDDFGLARFSPLPQHGSWPTSPRGRNQAAWWPLKAAGCTTANTCA